MAMTEEEYRQWTLHYLGRIAEAAETIAVVLSAQTVAQATTHPLTGKSRRRGF